MALILLPEEHSFDFFSSEVGGKAKSLYELNRLGFRVPSFFCVSQQAMQLFFKENQIDIARLPVDSHESIEELFERSSFPQELSSHLRTILQSRSWEKSWLSIRSSGLEEDGREHSFAGQFSSYLFQRGQDSIERSIKRCWASAYSARSIAYRRYHGLNTFSLRMGVIVQEMISCEKSGVAFSRNPVNPYDRSHSLISSVWGLGEGLVAGDLDADLFEFHRETKVITKQQTATKTHAYYPAPEGGLIKKELSRLMSEEASLTHEEVVKIAKACQQLEERWGAPQDFEWGIREGVLFCLQSRPITTLPADAFFDPSINGAEAVLWDNSNIIESYSGVTSPLTFSFASSAYRQVYIQFCEVMGVPKKIIFAREAMFRNMLGLIRGRIYYNLINWYHLVLMLPGASNNKAFMETMMGVKQKLKPEVVERFDQIMTPVGYSMVQRARLFLLTLYRWWRIDSIISRFQTQFDQVYQSARKIDFKSISFREQMELYQDYDENLLRKWHAPIINDYLCMVFFGLLKKLTDQWLGSDCASIQNDLLCGQGDIESTEPTKMLMRIAAWIDSDPKNLALKEWWLSRSTSEIVSEVFREGFLFQDVQGRLREFLERYGFRCVNELKLESKDLHDDPSFVIEAISSYIRRKSYSTRQMEIRELEIRKQAESQVARRLSGLRRWFYFRVLREARRSVRNRENLRFARTKIFGVVRHLFRGMGHRLVAMGQIETEKDVFFLTGEELIAWGEGRALTLDLKSLVLIRKREFTRFESSAAPPDRFLTQGCVGYSLHYPQVLAESDLMRSELKSSEDPNVLYGTPCCPGVIEGKVRVVKQFSDAEGMNGEILVTERTDPGWVPLYPSCSGLLIERGSLLSHSAVVARELGVPTIVGVTGGLLKRLKTGMRVRVDASRGEIRILSET